MRSKIARILIIAMSAMIVIGIILSVVLYYVNRRVTSENFTVVLGEEKTDSPPFSIHITGMRPGSSDEYTVLLKANHAAERRIYMEFTETEDKGISEFVDVELFINGESAQKTSMKKLFEEGSFKFTGNVSKKEPIQIKLVFTMSLDVGNEAMGTSSKFDIKITSDR